VLIELWGGLGHGRASLVCGTLAAKLIRVQIDFDPYTDYLEASSPPGQKPFMSKRNGKTQAGAGRALAELQLAQIPGYLIRRAHQRAVEIFDEEVGALGITPQQFAVLRAVEASPGLSQVEVVGATSIDRSTTTELISRLVERSLVRMSRSGDDRRSTVLYLTDAGSALLLQAVPGVLRAQERIMAPIPAGQRASLLRQIARLAQMDVGAGAAPRSRGRPPTRTGQDA